MNESTSSLSFKFSKTSRKQLIVQESSKIKIDDDQESASSDPVLISELTQKGFKDITTIIKEEKQEIIIPKLENTVRFPIPPISSSTSNDDPDSMAKRALLEEARQFIEKTEAEIKDITSIPSGENARKEEKRLDLSQFSNITDDIDYESISVDVFGKALLRGMGWKEGDAIGRAGKKSVQPVITAPRPKGLGLGATIKPPPGTSSTANSQQTNGQTSAEDSLVLKIGAYVKRMDAKIDKDRYGKVISWDEDNARVVVQMAIGKSIVRLSQHVVRVVTAKEYESAGKCINQSSYEEFKNEQDEKLEKRCGGHSEEPEIVFVEKRDSKKEKERDKDGPSSSRQDSRKALESRKRDRSRSPIKSTPKRWLRPDIRVRIVDEKYRRGKYYEKKAVVVDVKSQGVCSCLAEDGKTVLDDLKEEMLETVVPKNKGAAVVVVRGKYAGKIGTILERDTRNQSAVIQLIDSIKNISFDDICEYVGELPEF